MTHSPTERLGLLSRILGASFSFLVAMSTSARSDETPAPARPNVLFIAVDDLNHWVGHFGRNPQTITPNIDRLARRGVSFTRAYCAAPACNPSRAALMSGLRPSTSGIYHNRDDWRKAIPEAKTLPSLFRRHGYYVAGAGKIYHGGFDRRSEWDDYFKRKKPKERRPRADEEPEKSGAAGALKFRQMRSGDEALNDYHVASWCIEQLQRKHEKPFFLACGIFRPHLPWNVPKKYFDMHSLEGIELPPFKKDDLDDVPPAGKKMAGSSRDHARVGRTGLWKELVQAYLASITFADVQVGRVLDALNRSAYRDDTVVVLWGDHGWHLGEKLHWRKFALWEEATRTPLIWVAPKVTRPGGICERPVDLMSIYPTLADLCGLPLPAHVEGVSLRPLLADPGAPWERPAITTHGRGNHAVRSETWRYIRYADGGEELYDEARDPYEWTNVAARASLASVKAEHAKHLPRDDPGEKPRGR